MSDDVLQGKCTDGCPQSESPKTPTNGSPVNNATITIVRYRDFSENLYICSFIKEKMAKLDGFLNKFAEFYLAIITGDFPFIRTEWIALVMSSKYGFHVNRACTFPSSV